MPQAIDEAATSCRWRTLGLFQTAEKTLVTLALLEQLAIRTTDILVITKNPPTGLPPVNWLPVTWGVQGFSLGTALGLLLGVGLGWFFQVHFLWTLVLVVVLGGLGGAIGIRRPRPLLKPFWPDIQQGSYLVLIYTTQSGHQRVLHPIRNQLGNLYEKAV